jgi:hypothetical protein
MRPAQEEQKRRRWSEELRKIDQEMLVSWVYAMLGKVCGIGVVAEIIEGRNNRPVEDF